MCGITGLFHSRNTQATVALAQQGKWALRHLLYTHVVQALTDRPGTDFAIPVGAWMHRNLRGWGGVRP